MLIGEKLKKNLMHIFLPVYNSPLTVGPLSICALQYLVQYYPCALFFAYFTLAHFSCCTFSRFLSPIFVLHSFCVGLYPCCTFSYFTLFMLHLSSCCFILHSLHVALFLCCTHFVLHFFLTAPIFKFQFFCVVHFSCCTFPCCTFLILHLF